MAVSYDNLWKLLIDQKKKRTDLVIGAGISTSVLSKMGRNEYISLGSVDKICKYLGCTPDNVFTLTDER